jgi:hypothetical protein
METVSRVAQSVQWLSYGLDEQRSIPGRDRSFSLRHRLQTGTGAHAAYQMGNGGSFPGE